MTADRSEEAVDVVICGSGSAGLACTLWLSIYNDRYCKTIQNGASNDSYGDQSSASQKNPITYRVLESRGGPLKVGQADGVQCRTVEIYESFGLDHVLKNEGYWVNEVSFWAAEDAQDGENSRRKIVRTGRAADVQPGLSHQPHLILNQARINGLMLDRIKELKGRDVDYNWKITGVEVEKDNKTTHPVKVYAEKHGETTTFRAKYVLGADGAHSQVRHSLQIPMEGDTSNAVWGVMDVFPRTNFPDVRKKSTIRSEAGTLLIIPREGDSMVRNYIELPAGTNPKTVTLDDLQRRAKEIFWPYEIDFLKTAWWSAYSIGQRVARNMVDESGHVFLAGDACHTHSPKAGQGMNASLQDGYNLGWKLGALLTGQVDESILQTYIQERHEYARQLIDFDRYWAKLFSSTAKADGTKADPEEFNQAFVKGGVFTAGMAADYKGSALVDGNVSTQELARKIIVGQRLPSAQIVRMSDSKPFQLLSLLRSDGRWRIVVFAGDVSDGATISKLNRIGEQLVSENGILSRSTPINMQSDSMIETLIVLHGDREQLEFDQIHSTFKPDMHDLPMQNLHKIFFDDETWNHGHGKAYETLGIDPKQGCIVLARPDQYVSAVVGLDDVDKLTPLFEKFYHPIT